MSTTSTSRPNSRPSPPCTATWGAPPALLGSPSCRRWRSTAGSPTCWPRAALGDRSPADEITVAIALDRWWPTEGTRITGARNTATRLVVTGGRLAPLEDPAPTRSWSFPEPFGAQDVVALPFSEIITIASHLQASTVSSYFSRAPLEDLHDPDTPAPEAVDDTGRSAQRFMVDVLARTADGERRITVTGQDIYAVTAPIVVEAAVRLLDGRSATVGVAAPGALFDADDFLAALAPEHLTIDRHPAPVG